MFRSLGPSIGQVCVGVAVVRDIMANVVNTSSVGSCNCIVVGLFDLNVSCRRVVRIGLKLSVLMSDINV